MFDAAGRRARRECRRVENSSSWRAGVRVVAKLIATRPTQDTRFFLLCES
jgi:hypothetical protein